MSGTTDSAKRRKGRVRDAYGKQIKILSAAGLLKPHGTNPVREKIRPLMEGGWSLGGAAKALGVSANLANYHRKKAGGGIVRPDSKWPGSPRRAAELLERLEAYRERTGTTWKEVASHCGLSSGPFSRWRAGKRVPSDYTLDKVERFLSGERA